MATVTPDIQQLKRSMTIRYMIAIILIAVFSLAAFLSMDAVVKRMDKNAYLMNVSGKQRLLSQYIALDAYRVYSAEQTYLYDSELDVVKHRLQRNLKEMGEVNKMLSQGALKDGSSVNLSPEVYEMYFGELNLKFRVQQYLALVRLIIELPKEEHKQIIIRDIERFSEGILTDLDKVVLQFQKEGERRLQAIKDTKLGLFLLTLFVLLLEVFFIFRPMVNRIIQLSLAKDHTMEELERKVTLRTLHLEKVNKRLNKLAHHDALTGLRNRLNLEANIEEVIIASEKHGTEYAVLMLDIDWFKSVNDQYGHDTGDFVLREMAQILTQSVREGDHVYRAGGEEFVVLLNRISYQDTVKKAEKIRQSVAEHVFSANGVKIHKTLSGGLYHSSLFKVSGVKELLKLTDSALYTAKHAGRNRIIETRMEMLSGISAFNTVNAQLVFSDLKFCTVLAVDPEVFKLIGYRQEDLLSGKVSFMEAVLAPDRAVLKKVTLNASKESPFVSPIRMQHANGEEVSLKLEVYVSYEHKVLEVVVNLEGYSD